MGPGGCQGAPSAEFSSATRPIRPSLNPSVVRRAPEGPMHDPMHDRDDAYHAYLDQLARFEPLDRATEQKLARRWAKKGDVEAGHQLVRANLRFVVKIANG